MITDQEILELEKDKSNIKIYYDIIKTSDACCYCIWRDYLFSIDRKKDGRIYPSSYNYMIIKSFPYNKDYNSNYLYLKRDAESPQGNVISYKTFDLNKFSLSDNILHDKLFEIIDYVKSNITPIYTKDRSFIKNELNKSRRLYKIKLLKK